MSFEILKKHNTFSGETVFCQHNSKITKANMKFSYFSPCEVEEVDRAIIWLSGLTCTEENFITKAGAQSILSGTKTMVICPDTSPRGLDLKDEHASYDFGSGAGFYVNATTEGYKDHYRMYDYIVKDVVGLLESYFKVQNISLSGHSMGGHGALVMGLREKNTFDAVSAFSPIVNPMNCPWGQKAFQGYLGDNKEEWKEYDSCELIQSGNIRTDSLLVEQGLADDFLKDQLLTKNLEDACEVSGQKVQVSYQEGFDHSYYFISTFLKKHIDFLTHRA